MLRWYVYFMLRIFYHNFVVKLWCGILLTKHNWPVWSKTTTTKKTQQNLADIFFSSFSSWLNWLYIMALEFGIHLDKAYVLYVWRLIFYTCSIFKTQSSLKSMQNFSISRTKGSRDEPCKVTGTWGVVIWIPCSCRLWGRTESATTEAT